MRILFCSIFFTISVIAKFQRIFEVEEAINDLYKTLTNKKEKILFFTEHSKTQNAFTLRIEEGQVISMTLGIIQEIKSPEELAAVLIHEMGHIAHRHSILPLYVSRISNTTSALLGALIVAASGPAGILGILLARHAAERNLLSDIRKMENEADAFAMNAILRQGWSLNGMINIMDRWRMGDSLVNYEQTHPLPNERYRNAKQVARFAQNNPLPDKIIKIFVHLKKLAAIYLNRLPLDYENWEIHYKVVYLDFKKRWPEMLNLLKKENINSEDFFLAKAIWKIGKKEEALALIKVKTPTEQYQMLIKAEILFANKKYDEAIILLEKMKRKDPTDPAPFELEAKIMHIKNNLSATWLARANEYARLGDFSMAIKMAKLAKEKSKNSSQTPLECDVLIKRLEKLTKN